MISETSFVVLIALLACLSAYAPRGVTDSFERAEQRIADQQLQSEIAKAKATAEYVRSLGE